MSECPCGSGHEYDACCGLYIGGEPAPTAEALMRSRYTAYAQGDIDYLIDTLAPESLGDFDPIEAASTASEMTWAGLEIRDVSAGGAEDETGIVEFVANYRAQDQQGIHHERSTFRREQGRWVCVGGEVNPKPPPRQVEKVGRNEPCPCGSGKKFKKCCGA